MLNAGRKTGDALSWQDGRQASGVGGLKLNARRKTEGALVGAQLAHPVGATNALGASALLSAMCVSTQAVKPNRPKVWHPTNSAMQVNQPTQREMRWSGIE